jgi:predicted enzyme related to lactoylglutathione lyase
MPAVQTKQAHRPTWIDLASPDLELTKRFYAGLFGWQAEQIGGPEMGNYSYFSLSGKHVGGLATVMDPGQHPAWTVYFGTDDADGMAEKIRGAGGEIVMGPDSVGDAGRMCYFRDPTGAFAALWQPGAMAGLQVQHENGALDWTELQTRDVPRAKTFYQAVFGWGEDTTPMGSGQPEYTQWKLEGESIGGAMAMAPEVPAEVPPNWLVYFRAADLERATAAVTAGGGSVLMAPMPFPGGSFAVAADPHGATFGLMRTE